MPDPGIEIMRLITDALSQFNSIIDNPASSADDKKKAADTYEDLLLLSGRQAVDRYEGRTAILTGLIAELNEFTKGIQVKNPIASQVGNLTALADKAMTLFKNEKGSAKG